MSTLNITIEAEATEQQLVEVAAAAIKQSNWIIGEAASKWTERYAAGRTDADFAELIGSSQQVVNYARRVHERFYNHGCKHNFAWRHWRSLLTWDDAEECLNWAEATEATFDEMKAWRRARRGEDLTEPEEPQEDVFQPTHELPPPDTQIAKPAEEKPARPKKTKQRDSSNGPAAEEPRAGTSPNNSPEAPNSRLEHVLTEVQEVSQIESVRNKLVTGLWKLLSVLDPEKARAAKPTVSALIAAIPSTLDPLIIEAAKQWAKYRQAGPSKERMRDVAQWETVLKRMTQYQPEAVLDAVEEAIANGWTGWTHKLDATQKLGTARVRGTQPQQPVYRDFDDE